MLLPEFAYNTYLMLPFLFCVGRSLLFSDKELVAFAEACSPSVVEKKERKRKNTNI